MKKAMVVIAVFVTAVSLVSWTHIVAALDGKPTPETIKDTEARFLKAALEHGSTGYLSFYSESAVELPDGADALIGRANIARTMRFLDDKNNRLTWAPVGADISASGDLGYTWGTYEFRSKGPDGVDRVEHGKYLTVWKKQPDGTWKVAVDMGNKGPVQR